MALGGFRRFLLRSLCLGLLVAVPGRAPAEPRPMREDEAMAVRAVGRLNVAGNRSCTATLISDRLVLTAAHCLFSPLTGRRSQSGAMTFVAGQWRDDYAALRKVVRTATLPGYAMAPGGAVETDVPDVALLELDQAITAGEVAPLTVADWHPADALSIIAYGQDRAYMPSVREDCLPRLFQGEMAVLSCAVVPGVSGAPVLAMTEAGARVVAVVSAKIGPGAGEGPAVVVAVAPFLGALKAGLTPE